MTLLRALLLVHTATAFAPAALRRPHRRMRAKLWMSTAEEEMSEAQLLKFYSLTADADAFEKTRTDPLVAVRASKITSAGKGVFAKKAIAAGTTITE